MVRTRVLTRSNPAWDLGLYGSKMAAIENVRLGYCFTPYQRPGLYNGAPLVAFYDTLGIRRIIFDLNPSVLTGGYRKGNAIYFAVLVITE